MKKKGNALKVKNSKSELDLKSVTDSDINRRNNIISSQPFHPNDDDDDDEAKQTWALGKKLGMIFEGSDEEIVERLKKISNLNA